MRHSIYTFKLIQILHCSLHTGWIKTRKHETENNTSPLYFERRPFTTQTP